MSFHGLPCWYELGAKDAEAAQGFYSAVLDWGWRDAGMPGMDYRLALAGETMVAGMMPVMGPEQPVAWTVYFAVMTVMPPPRRRRVWAHRSSCRRPTFPRPAALPS